MEEKLWQLFLTLREQVKDVEGDCRFCHIQTCGAVAFDRLLPAANSGREVIVVFDADIPDLRPEGSIVLRVSNQIESEVLASGVFSAEESRFLQAYLPYCFLPMYSRKEKRAVTVAHFAQSLDGRIATTSGKSKWIGNEENRIHAHRMRALCDGIMVGSGTLRRDKPRLTVRLVEGEDPVRVVLGSSCRDFSSLYRSSPERIIVIGPEPCYLNGQVDYVCLPAYGGWIPSQEILKCLYQKGIYSVYLEGGPATTSNFLRERSIDILQLHFSPLIFGSGKPAIVLPEIEEVGEAIAFRRFFFQPVGNTMMFTGLLNDTNQ